MQSVVVSPHPQQPGSGGVGTEGPPHPEHSGPPDIPRIAFPPAFKSCANLPSLESALPGRLLQKHPQPPWAAAGEGCEMQSRGIST